MRSVAVSFTPIDDGMNPLFADSAGVVTSVLEAATVLLPALLVVRAPIAIVLAKLDEEKAMTSTDTVHVPLAGMVPPESATLPPPAAAVTVPPQLETAP